MRGAGGCSLAAGAPKGLAGAGIEGAAGMGAGTEEATVGAGVAAGAWTPARSGISIGRFAAGATGSSAVAPRRPDRAPSTWLTLNGPSSRPAAGTAPSRSRPARDVPTMTAGAPMATSFCRSCCSVTLVSTRVVSANRKIFPSTPPERSPDARASRSWEVDSTETTSAKRPLARSAFAMAGNPATTTVRFMRVSSSFDRCQRGWSLSLCQELCRRS